MYTRVFRSGPALLLAALVALSACSDSTEPDEHELDVHAVVLTAGTSTVTINRTTGAPSGELVVPAGTVTITAAWLRPDGSVEDEVHADEFELRIVPTSTAVATFTPSGAFGGSLTITGLTSGQTTTAQVSLLHIEENHEDFGPYTFTIRVQ